MFAQRSIFVLNAKKNGQDRVKKYAVATDAYKPCN